MATPKKLQVALDGNVALLFEAGAEFCEKVFETLQKLKLEIHLTETVLQEIQDQAENASAPLFSDLALSLLRKCHSHGIKTNGLKNYQNGCAEQLADFVLEKCVPNNVTITKNEALIVAETSLHEMEFLIVLPTSPLLKLNGKWLNLCLTEKDGFPITILSTDDILRIVNDL